MADFEFDVGCLRAAFARSGWTKQEVEGLCEGDTLSRVHQFLFTAPGAGVEPALVLGARTDSVIRVDRTVLPTYPEWMQEVLRPDLEQAGPAEYSISQVEQWFHCGQKDGGVIKGVEIYAHLKKSGELETHLGTRDLEAIQKKGISFFREHFAGKAVFGWKGVLRDRDGSLCAPYLCGHGVEVLLRWYWLGNGWFGRDPALRLAS